MKAAIVFALLVLIGPASKGQTGPDTTAFGFKLGAPLSIPECPHLKRSTLYLYNDAAPCFERIISSLDSKKWKTPVVSETIFIDFPVAHIPKLVSGLKIVGQVVNGNLEAVSFNTAGLSAQDSTLATLQEKYGEPTQVATVKKANAYGAKFDSLLATWSFANLSVVFQGMTDRIDSGLVNIDTPTGIAYREHLGQPEGTKL